MRTVLGSLRLGIVGCENHRTVGISTVAELAAPIQGIHVAPVTAQQLGITDLIGIKAHLHRFLVSRCFTAHLAVGGPFHLSAAVAAGGLQHPGQLFKIMLKAPETATGKDRCGLPSPGGIGQSQQSNQQSCNQPGHGVT